MSLLKDHCEAINNVRIEAQNRSTKEYTDFWNLPRESFLANLELIKEKYMELEQPIADTEN